MIKTIVLGAGFVASHLLVGLENIRNNIVEKHGIPLGEYPLPYDVNDISVEGVYDVDDSKVGKTMYDIARSVLGGEAVIPQSLENITIERGVHRGSLEGMDIKAKGLEDDIGIEGSIKRLADEWERIKPDVIVNTITTEYGEIYPDAKTAADKILGGEAPATHVYAYAALEYAKKYGEKVSFVNAIPTPVANNPGLLEMFEESGSIALGDDGATGATPLTSDLLSHLSNRNRFVKFIAQFNIGGNTDFLALTLPDKNEMKEYTKTSMIKDILGYEPPHYIKPTGYLEPLGDKKYVAMHIEYKSFNGYEDSLFISARINDSPALAGMLVDLIRLGKLALDRRKAGTIYEINSFYMKRPGPLHSKNIAKTYAYEKLLEWIKIGD
jgi:myo-inositol-1-phosphate synthase